ncbi:MAG: DUF4438 domain-containing protein [Defluviitaleaceae bacterium]|nr:DUF4438 domain-containing protein [Defluviitaleaceae bacterium]
MRTNAGKLPIVSVSGTVWHPKGGAAAKISLNGEAVWLTGTGGITYNAKIGDLCADFVADHLEPGVTARNKEDDFNQAFTVLSCIGNEARIRSGDAKDERGFVTGKHGGCEHLIIYFSPETLEKLNIGDTISIKATGQGLELLDYPQIKMRSVSPALLEKMNFFGTGDTCVGATHSLEVGNGAGNGAGNNAGNDVSGGKKLRIGVSKIVPAKIMGSGIGHMSTVRGDYDITMADAETVEKYGLNDLRFGDIVAITDADTRFGRVYKQGACTIGVVVHGGSVIAGHGPGVTTLMTAAEPIIAPFLDANANLAEYFLCG